MSNSHFFNDEVHSSGEYPSEKLHYKRPEFILIDDRQETKQYSHFGSDSQKQQDSQSEGKEDPLQGAISLRLLCFLGLIFSLIFGLGVLIWSMVLTFLALCSFFQKPHLNKNMSSFWKIFIHTVVAILGFTLGLIAPVFGFSFVALYFSLIGGIIDNHFLNKFFQRSFNQL